MEGWTLVIGGGVGKSKSLIILLCIYFWRGRGVGWSADAD